MSPEEFADYIRRTDAQITKLRSEAAKYRHQRNDLRVEVAQLRAEQTDVVRWPGDRPLPKPGEPGYRAGRVYLDYEGGYLGRIPGTAETAAG